MGRLHAPFTLEDTRYEITAAIDEATGHYQGVHADSGTPVTVRIISEPEAATFRPELARQLGDAHDNIMPVLATGVGPDYHYVVMPHLAGNTLDQALTLAMSVDQALKILTDVAHALDFAHHQGAVHGALSAHSVMLDATGRVLVRGFELTEPDARYAAPETFEAQALPQSDQYAVAIMAFQMLTDGQHIFPLTDSMSDAELTNKHRHEPPRRLSTARPDLPDEMNNVLLKALSKAPNDRYPTVWAFVRALENAFRSAPGVVERQHDHLTESYVTQPPEREDKWKRLWLPLTAVALSAIIGVVLLLIFA